MSEPGGPESWAEVVKKSFGLSFWIFVLVALLFAVICYNVLGKHDFDATLRSDGEMITSLLPRVIAAQIVAGLIWVLVSRERMSKLVKKSRGKRGLLIATAAGIITPGGPMSAYPFLAILAGTGADRGILVTYITSWALLGVQRIIVWDIPLMGMDFSLLRFAVGLPLPIVAGLIARRIPFTVDLRDLGPARGERQ
ncbi:MAG: hypothetical protein HKN77_06645 [Woeseiaceae bacterium]|nr:hypothetical protein [Woeseiaceae bacterium]